MEERAVDHHLAAGTGLEGQPQVGPRGDQRLRLAGEEGTAGRRQLPQQGRRRRPAATASAGSRSAQALPAKRSARTARQGHQQQGGAPGKSSGDGASSSHRFEQRLGPQPGEAGQREPARHQDQQQDPLAARWPAARPARASASSRRTGRPGLRIAGQERRRRHQQDARRQAGATARAAPRAPPAARASTTSRASPGAPSGRPADRPSAAPSARPPPAGRAAAAPSARPAAPLRPPPPGCRPASASGAAGAAGAAAPRAGSQRCGSPA